MTREREAKRSWLPSPIEEFLHTEAAGALLLAVAAIAGLVWANSPWSGAYRSIWSTRASVGVGGHVLDLDLRHWVDDGLMTLFFLVVGLEIIRELRGGQLSSARAAALPGLAAIGGMLVPVAVYLAVAGSTAPRGWAVPMATDIALATGVLAVAGARAPSSLRTFLLALAIVDDIGAVIVIAVAYSSGISFGWLALGAAAVVVTAVARRFGLRSYAVYIALGAALWWSLHEAGVHPTLAGVVMGLLAPAVASDEDDGRSVAERVQHALHPWTSFLVVPVFAFANVGVQISSRALGDAVRSPIAWGIVAGLVVGKPLGVLGLVRGAVGAGTADLPEGTTYRHIGGAGVVSGIGFTVALFITDLAFESQAERTTATIAVLVASVLAAALAFPALRSDEP